MGLERVKNVLGAPGGETSSGDSTSLSLDDLRREMRLPHLKVKLTRNFLDVIRENEDRGKRLLGGKLEFWHRRPRSKRRTNRFWPSGNRPLQQRTSSAQRSPHQGRWCFGKNADTRKADCGGKNDRRLIMAVHPDADCHQALVFTEQQWLRRWQTIYCKSIEFVVLEIHVADFTYQNIVVPVWYFFEFTRKKPVGRG